MLPGASLDSKDGAEAFKFEDHYVLGSRIAKGSFGIVHNTKHEKAGEDFAVKVIDRSKISEKDDKGVFREVSILKDLRDVENIVRLIDFYVSPSCFYVVQLLAEGGDVFERLASRTSYTEKDARALAINLIEAMDALHERKLAHRDLKPENLLLASILSDTGILVADFGFAAYVPEGGLKTRCGTPAFVAPEVLFPDCRYTERVDMWSVGCLLYMLLGGYPPFQDRNHRGLFRKIRGADYCFHDAYFKNVSISAKQLISSLLTVDPKYRCSARLALEKSSWLQMRDDYLSENDLSASLGEIKKFHARQKLKGAMHAVAWSVKSKFMTDTAGFSKQMKSWDESDEGEDRVNKALLTSVRPTLKFSDVYELGKLIHGGGTAEVFDCEHKTKKEIFAVKKIRRDEVKKSTTGKTLTESVMHELAVLNSINHKYIIKIIDFFEEDEYFYMIMEKMEGGDLFDRVMKRRQYTEKDARDLAIILIEAVDHLHQHGIAHRDLKPQNLLLKSKDDDAAIKIADFGFACRVHTPQSLTTRCGTPTYVAPEILKNIPYDNSADMWSVGVILFVLLCGYPPFADDNQTVLFQKIRMAEWEFVERDWSKVSDEAKELIKNLLIPNPLRRWTAKEALRSRWLGADDAQLSSTDLTESLETIKRRNPRLVNIAKTIMWMSAKGASTRNLNAVETMLSRKEDETKSKEKPTPSGTDTPGTGLDAPLNSVPE